MRSQDEPSGRRRTFTEDARRAQIERAAVETVNALGYPRASLAEIATRAQVAKSAIVYYFETKESLLLHVVDQAFEALGADLVAATAAPVPPTERLAGYAHAYLDHVDRHRAAIAAAVEIVVAHRDADGVPLYLREAEEDTALLRAILAEGTEAGVFAPLPPEVAVTIVTTLLDAAITMVQRDADADLSTYRDTIVPFLLSSLAAQHRG